MIQMVEKHITQDDVSPHLRSRLQKAGITHAVDLKNILENKSAAVLGSTFYDLPQWLHWLTGNIGYHHLHHLNSTIPSYELARCFEQEPLLQQTAQKVTFFQSLRFTRCHLRDEQQQKMISFRAYRQKKSRK